MSKTGGSKKNSRLARAKKLAKLGRLTGKAAAKTVVTAARTLPAVVGAVTAFAGTLRSGLKTIKETTAVREAQPLKGEITMKKSTLIALIVFLSTIAGALAAAYFYLAKREKELYEYEQMLFSEDYEGDDGSEDDTDAADETDAPAGETDKDE